ncbi:hypothetical protein ACLBXO_01875 [Methylobacterium sp. C33D]
MRPTEILGGDEAAVTGDDRDAELHRAGSELGQGIGHLVLSSEGRWTGQFRIPGDVLRQKPQVVGLICKNAWLCNSAGQSLATCVLHVHVSEPLKEN